MSLENEASFWPENEVERKMPPISPATTRLSKKASTAQAFCKVKQGSKNSTTHWLLLFFCF